MSPPKIFYCDFEQSIIKAVNDVFPETTIVCCDAHFKRAIRRNIQAKHLQSSYNRSIGLQTLVRYLWGLSLVPVTDVIKVWEQFILPSLPEDAPAQWEVTEEHLENFLEYFEKTWIGGKDIRTNSRRNLCYRHELWNKYDAVINDNDTTTNASEGFNHVLQMSIPNHANVWQIIKQFKNEDGLMSLKLRDAAIGVNNDAGRKKSRERQQKKKDLRNLLCNYHNLSLEQYMEFIVNYFNDCIVPGD